MSAIGLVGRSQVPQSHIFKIMGGGGVRLIFLGLKFWSKVIFRVYKRRRDFFGSRKKNRGIFFFMPPIVKLIFKLILYINVVIYIFVVVIYFILKF